MAMFELPNDPATQLAFDFFYRFARLEYALKASGFVKGRPDAAPNWGRFVVKHADAYKVTGAAAELMTEPPLAQVVIEGTNDMAWKPVDLSKCRSELAMVVRLLKTMRNNLFHGGKKGPEGWSQPLRMTQLLNCGVVVIEELVILGDLKADYELPG